MQTELSAADPPQCLIGEFVQLANGAQIIPLP